MSTTTAPALTIDLTSEEADAIVYAVARAIHGEADKLDGETLSAVPGDLAGMQARSRRISRLADVNEQLKWRAHWRNIQSDPEPLEAAEAVLIDVVSELLACADEQRRCGPDEDDGAFAFDEAARTIARVFAGAVA